MPRGSLLLEKNDTFLSESNGLSPCSAWTTELFIAELSFPRFMSGLPIFESAKAVAPKFNESRVLKFVMPKFLRG